MKITEITYEPQPDGSHKVTRRVIVDHETERPPLGSDEWSADVEREHLRRCFPDWTDVQVDSFVTGLANLSAALRQAGVK